MGKDAAAEMAVKTKIGKVKNEMRKLESRAESLGLDVVYMEQRVKEKKEQCERYDQSLSAITEEVASRDELAGQIMVSELPSCAGNTPTDIFGSLNTSDHPPRHQ
jgi:hypothetical protein